jgi:hypothetical protein
LEIYDNILEKVEDFQARKSPAVANYDALKAGVDAKRSDVLDVIVILAALPEFDCATEDPAEAVAAVKLAVGNTRPAVHEYRGGIKDLVVTLKKSGHEQPSKSEQEVNK